MNYLITHITIVEKYTSFLSKKCSTVCAYLMPYSILFKKNNQCIILERRVDEHSFISIQQVSASHLRIDVVRQFI
ncbi:MAG TPA: hypothetical protein VIM07_12840 [Chitinophagaceae bacterium]